MLEDQLGDLVPNSYFEVRVAEIEEEDSLGADPYLPSRHIESFLRVFKQFACNIPRG